MSVIATWSPVDAALDILAPLGLAVAAGTALVIDGDPSGPAVGTGPTLAQLHAEGPTRSQMEPPSTGAAFLSNGGVTVEEAADLIRALVARWPAVVLRCEARGPRPEGAIGFAPLLPEPHTIRLSEPAVYQRCRLSPGAPPNGSVLPVPSRRTVERLMAGRAPLRSDRWIRSLGDVWRLHG